MATRGTAARSLIPKTASCTNARCTWTTADRNSLCADILVCRGSEVRKHGFDSSRNAASKCVTPKETPSGDSKSPDGFFVRERSSHAYHLVCPAVYQAA